MKLLYEYQPISSPSKIGQWRKPKPAAKRVLTLVRCSPLTLEERVRGSMIDSRDCIFAIFIPLSHFVPAPLS